MRFVDLPAKSCRTPRSRPERSSFDVLIQGAAALDDLARAERYLFELERRGERPHSESFRAVGSSERAIRLVDKARCVGADMDLDAMNTWRLHGFCVAFGWLLPLFSGDQGAFTGLGAAPRPPLDAGHGADSRVETLAGSGEPRLCAVVQLCSGGTTWHVKGRFRGRFACSSLDFPRFQPS